ncbi:hypothetical protein FA95DRAFT_1575830 [Auriscalpium vulgare]|uniref:Uncharacterized protein n=1 Tax=Auriscalpium vulgare TaxID=40419 RepID=A0ACB8RFA9_9AGAM|nr:hypothetical protein FA95DRAFT_1575830 [Auriscalpium vulgare]
MNLAEELKAKTDANDGKMSTSAHEGRIPALGPNDKPPNEYSSDFHIFVSGATFEYYRQRERFLALCFHKFVKTSGKLEFAEQTRDKYHLTPGLEVMNLDLPFNRDCETYMVVNFGQIHVKLGGPVRLAKQDIPEEMNARIANGDKVDDNNGHILVWKPISQSELVHWESREEHTHATSGSVTAYAIVIPVRFSVAYAGVHMCILLAECSLQNRFR